MTDYPPTLQVTFSMDDGTDYFTIEGDNTLAALATFNYEKVASVAVTIRATDNQGLHTVKRLLIQVCVPASVCGGGGGGGGGGRGERRGRKGEGGGNCERGKLPNCHIAGSRTFFSSAPHRGMAFPFPCEMNPL